MTRTIVCFIAVAALLAAYPRAQSAPPQTGPRAAAPAEPVNLNTATVRELEELPGIGPRTAARIVEYREKKGPFKKIEELMNVQGIGEKLFLGLKARITVASKPEPATAAASPRQS